MYLYATCLGYHFVWVLKPPRFMFWSLKEVSHPLVFFRLERPKPKGVVWIWSTSSVNHREPKAGKKVVQPGVWRDKFNIFKLDFHCLYTCVLGAFLYYTHTLQIGWSFFWTCRTCTWHWVVSFKEKSKRCGAVNLHIFSLPPNTK